MRPGGFSLLPPVVKNLLIINGLAFLINVALSRYGIDLNQKLGLYLPGSSYFNPYQLVTHLFMHGSFMHLFSNMFSLWMFGSALENYWGPKRFLTYYLVTGFGAALIHLGVNYYEVYSLKNAVAEYLANPGYNQFYSIQELDKRLFDMPQMHEFIKQWSFQKDNIQLINYSKEIADAVVQRKLNIPTVGASGAVFGVLLAFGMLFPNTLLFLIFIPIPIKAKYFVMIYGLFELYQGVQNNPADNVAHFAHLGGMLFGFILIKYWNKHNRSSFY
jgi:membrane associated rhomboid family serine protease